MEKAALYIRVSTDEQTEYSPAAQLDELLKYANEHSLTVDESFIFRDEGISGRNAAHRPAFLKMIALAKKKPRPFDVILCHKFDRFARSREDSVIYKALLKRDCGIRVISIKEPVPQDDKFGVIYESMLEAMAEYYSLNLAEEVKKTMVKKAENGEYQAFAPFGYINQNKTLVPNEVESKIVQFIFSEFIKGKSYYSIAQQLNLMGIKTHKNNHFDSRAIKYILQNPVYIGFSRWTPTGKAGRTQNSTTIVAKGNFTSIVSQETFALAQQIISSKPNTPRHIRQNTPWFSGMVKCSCCGASLVCGQYYKNGGCQLQCGNYNHGICKTSHSISSNRLENAFFTALNQQYNNSNIESYQITVKQKEGSNTQAFLAKNSIRKLTQNLEKAKTAYLNGVDTLEEYKTTKIEFLKRIKELEEVIPFSSSCTEKFQILPTFNQLAKNNPILLQLVIKKIIYCSKENCFKIYFITN
ncbi:MAG: recombinase family protein [Lachnospiraceae bacterium]|nr:recombinase family protein [Lachnospiraceae bacterium]